MSVCEIADRTAHPNCALKRLATVLRHLTNSLLHITESTVLPHRLKEVSVDFYGVKCYYCKSVNNAQGCDSPNIQ